jgi:hypothetical protein
VFVEAAVEAVGTGGKVEVGACLLQGRRRWDFQWRFFTAFELQLEIVGVFVSSTIVSPALTSGRERV